MERWVNKEQKIVEGGSREANLPGNDHLSSNEKSDKVFLILGSGLLDFNLEKLHV